MGDAIKYLYDKFILRDLFSFITPGAIVILTAIVLFVPQATLLAWSRYIPWLFYIPLFGIFYVTGFAVQCLGVFLGCIRLHKIEESSITQRFRMLFGKLRSKEDVSKSAREKEVDFLNATAKAVWARQHHERSVILKQMCANNLWAVIIVVFTLLLKLLWPSPMGLLIIAVLLLISLFWGYRSSELAVDTIEDKVKSLNNNKELKEDN